MSARQMTRAGAAIAGSALAAALLVAPATAAVAAPLPATTQTTAEGGCEITGGTMTWGLKESFRSYISGSIANGSWEPSDGASYETPNFLWKDAKGSIDPETGTGTVSFVGTIHFTGHDGVLDLTLANPTIEFEGDGKAALMLDAKSTDMEGKVAVDSTQEWVGSVTVKDALAPSGDKLELSGLATELTNSGADAFAGFYEAGTKLDPISLALEFSGCDASAAAPAPEAPAEETPEPAPVVEAAPALPWLPITIGGVALFVIGLTTGLLIGGRRPKAAPEQDSAEDLTPEA